MNKKDVVFQPYRKGLQQNRRDKYLPCHAGTNEKQQISAHQEEKFKDIEITVKEGVETPLVNSEEKLDGQY